MSTAQERMREVVKSAEYLAKMQTQHRNSPFKQPPMDECTLCTTAKKRHAVAVREYTHPMYTRKDRS